MGKYQSDKFEKSHACSKKLIRIISCAPFKAHTEPLMFARRILSVTDINIYMSGIFMYQCLNCSMPKVFDDFFQRNSDVHGHNTRQANDLHVPYARLDIRKSKCMVLRFGTILPYSSGNHYPLMFLNSECGIILLNQKQLFTLL